MLPGSWHGEVAVVTEGFRLDVTGAGLTAADVRRDVQNALHDEDSQIQPRSRARSAAWNRLPAFSRPITWAAYAR